MATLANTRIATRARILATRGHNWRLVDLGGGSGRVGTRVERKRFASKSQRLRPSVSAD